MSKKLSAWKKYEGFNIPLTSTPVDLSNILVQFSYTTLEDVAAKAESVDSIEFTYENLGGEPTIIVDTQRLWDKAIEGGADGDTEVTIEVKYVPSQK